MTKTAKTAVKDQPTRAWPLQFMNVRSWYTLADGSKVCGEWSCEREHDYDAASTYKDGGKWHKGSDLDRWYDVTTDNSVDGEFVCVHCGTQLTKVRPNPWAITSMPTIDQVVRTVHLTSSLDNLFRTAYFVKAKADAVKASVEFNGYDTHTPDWYDIRNDNITISFTRVAELKMVLAQFLESTNADASDKPKVTRLIKMVDKAMTEAVKEAAEDHAARIAEVTKVATRDNARGSWLIKAMPDSCNNRGMMYVKAFELNEDGEIDKYAYGRHGSEITAYINVNDDGDAMMRFEVKPLYGVDGEGDEESTVFTLDEAIEIATRRLNILIDLDVTHAQTNTEYAREALEDAGIAIPTEVK